MYSTLWLIFFFFLKNENKCITATQLLFFFCLWCNRIQSERGSKTRRTGGAASIISRKINSTEPVAAVLWRDGKECHYARNETIFRSNDSNTPNWTTRTSQNLRLRKLPWDWQEELKMSQELIILRIALHQFYIFLKLIKWV